MIVDQGSVKFLCNGVFRALVRPSESRTMEPQVSDFKLTETGVELNDVGSE